MKRKLTLLLIPLVCTLLIQPVSVNAASSIALNDTFDTFSSANWTIDPATPEEVTFSIGGGTLTLDAQDYTPTGNADLPVSIRSKTINGDFYAIIRIKDLLTTTSSTLPGIQVGVEFGDGKRYLQEFGYSNSFTYTYDSTNGYNNRGGSSNNSSQQLQLPKELHIARLGQDVFYLTKDETQASTPMQMDMSIYRYAAGNVPEFVNANQTAKVFIGLVPHTINEVRSFSATFDQVKVTSFDNDLGTVYRMFSHDTGAHLYTVSTIERDTVLRAAGSRWTYDGATYSVEVDEVTGTVPVHRFFNTVTGAHLYTISESEKDTIENTLDEYVYEGEVYFVYSQNAIGTIPVYRFFNTQTGAHLYTVSESEKDTILSTLSQYTFEGIKYYVNP